jgi:hypothetical protein
MNAVTLAQRLRAKSFVLFFALLVGVLSVLPQFLAPLALGKDYKGIQFFYLDDEDIYRARIHEILDGYGRVASPYVYEYKEVKTVVPPINEYLYAGIALIFGLSGAIVLSKFLFPILLFLLIYLFVTRLIDREDEDDAMWSGIASGLLVTLGYDLVDYRTVFDIIRNGTDIEHLLVWTRLVNPITGALVFFSFLLALWAVFARGGRANIAVAATLLAVSVGYFFSFGIAASTLGVLMLITLLLKDMLSLKRLGAVLGLSLLLQLPYWVSTLSSMGGTAGKVTALRNGMFFTHEFILNKVLLFVTVIVFGAFLYALRTKIILAGNKSAQFLLALILASWVVFNQQVLTGREIWPSHFVQYTIPIAFIALLYVAFIVIRPKLPRLWFSFIMLAVLVSVSWGVFSALSYRYVLADFRDAQGQAALIDWLNRNGEKDSVVLIKEYDEPLERNIPAYTRSNVYSTTYGFFGITPERIKHNFYIRLRLLGIDANTLAAYLDTHEDEVRGYFFEDWSQMFGHGKDAWLTEKEAQVSDEYMEFLRGDLKQQLTKYRLDYLVSKQRIIDPFLAELPGLKLVATPGAYFVYSFAHQ